MRERESERGRGVALMVTHVCGEGEREEERKRESMRKSICIN